MLVYLQPVGLCDAAAVLAVFTGNYQRAALVLPRKSWAFRGVVEQKTANLRPTMGNLPNID
jgi:hypothetical protein